MLLLLLLLARLLLVIWYLFYINIRLDDSAHSDHLQAAWTP